MLSEPDKVSSCVLKAMRCMQHDAQGKKKSFLSSEFLFDVRE